MECGGDFIGLKENEKLKNSSIYLSYYDPFWLKSFNCTERLDKVSLGKKELGVKALVRGTIVGFTTPNLMANLDYIDAHAYWQYTVFSGKN